MKAVRPRLLALGLAPLALAACGGGGTTASAPDEPSAPVAAPGPKAMTLTVISVQTAARSHDRAPKGRSAGDRIEFANTLRNTTPRFGKGANERIGSDAGTMTFTSKSTARMKGVATLPDGTIDFEGAVTVLPNDTVTVPVVGGTGTYANASGTLLVGSGNGQAPNTYRIVVGGTRGPVA
jgi:hypothetical protein